MLLAPYRCLKLLSNEYVVTKKILYKIKDMFFNNIFLYKKKLCFFLKLCSKEIIIIFFKVVCKLYNGTICIIYIVFKGFDMLIYFEGMRSWNVCGVNKKRGILGLRLVHPFKKSLWMSAYIFSVLPLPCKHHSDQN